MKPPKFSDQNNQLNDKNNIHKKFFVVISN